MLNTRSMWRIAAFLAVAFPLSCSSSKEEDTTGTDAGAPNAGGERGDAGSPTAGATSDEGGQSGAATAGATSDGGGQSGEAGQSSGIGGRQGSGGAENATGGVSDGGGQSGEAGQSSGSGGRQGDGGTPDLAGAAGATASEGGAAGATASEGGAAGAPDVGEGILVVTGMGAAEIPNEGTYVQTTLDGIPPYSSGVATISVENAGESDVTIRGVDLAPVDAAEEYEWTVNTPGSTNREPMVVQETVLAPGESLDFGLFFYPLASGPRNVEVTIGYGESSTHTFQVVARGRDNATFSTHASTAFERVFGRSNVASPNGVQPGALRADADGNVYFNVNASQWDDNFRNNLVLSRVDADGTLAWVRELQEDNDQVAYDIGNNGELGGNQDSISLGSSGDIYLTAQRALTTTASFQAFILKADAATGELAWAEGITNGTAESPSTAAQVLRGQAVDASLADRVLIAGQVADSAGAYLMALDKADGAILWAKTFSVSGAHRVSSLTTDGAGSAYLAGISNNAPFAVRVDGVDGDAPAVAWAQRYTPTFANIHAMILDGDGLLAAFDVRGATTAFAAVRMSAADGTIVWAKQFDDQNSTDNNNTVAVGLHNGQAVFAGRISISPFDTQGGEGFLLALDPATGGYGWGAFHYGGKGAEEMTMDHVTGIASTTQGLWVLHQQTPGSNNHNHFWGRWYEATDHTLELPGGDGSERLVDLESIGVTSATATLTDLTAATVHPVADAATKWSDQTSAVEFLEPVQAEADLFQTGTHALVQRLNIE